MASVQGQLGSSWADVLTDVFSMSGRGGSLCQAVVLAESFGIVLIVRCAYRKSSPSRIPDLNIYFCLDLTQNIPF